VQYNDTLYGDGGRDDIIGGHNVRHGEDGGDTIYGGDGSDAVLGDNGQIVRHLVSATDYPWFSNIVWLAYVQPFDEEVVHEIRRYEDIDEVGASDTIYGDAGNDILHGQRGDDYISGGIGEDEIYGEHGHDTLLGDDGHDIVLGDVGYAVRRYDAEGQAVQQKHARGTNTPNVWHKDIVLEEVGNITGVDLISKKIDTNKISALDLLASSFLFVAAAYKSDGSKYIRESDGGWVTQMIRYQLVPAYNDDIDGGDGNDILIGQRGEDYIKTGNGNDLAIGDAGWNTIPINTDMPRIYQIYRAMKDTSASNLVVSASDFGVTFAAEFELFPEQYRPVDALSSIIDVAVNLDDIYEQSNLLKDKLGVSGLSVTSREYSLQPMFRVTPGFINERQWMHGNDRIESGIGESIIIGDDIRGFSALDFAQDTQFETLRQDLDNLVQMAATRLNNIEVDSEFYENDPVERYNLTVGCDTINTHIEGVAMVTADTMTIMGRSFQGGPLIKGRFLWIKTDKIMAIVNRLFDIVEVMWKFNFALFEIHHKVLSNMLAIGDDRKPQQEPLHHLYLSSDVIDSNGNRDLIVGDSSLLYFAVDRPGVRGFEFRRFNRWQSLFVRRKTRKTRRSRTNALRTQVNTFLSKSSSLSNDQVRNLAYADVPFYLTVATDTIMMNYADNIASGDYAFVGVTQSARRVPEDLTKLEVFTQSMRSVRHRPAVGSNLFKRQLFDLPSYNERFSSTVANRVRPDKMGDTFVGNSMTNVVFGEVLVGVCYNTFSAGLSRFSVDDDRNAYQTMVETSWVDGDFFDFPAGVQVDGQLGNDRVSSDQVLIDGDLTVDVRRQMNALLFDHDIIVQMRTDMWYEPLYPRNMKGVKTGYQTTNPVTSSYIPSYSINDMNPQNRFTRRLFSPLEETLLSPSALQSNKELRKQYRSTGSLLRRALRRVPGLQH